MKKLFILGTIMVSAFSYSQVGIGTENPHATLDIVATGDNNATDGILIPRLTRAELTNKGNALYTSNQIGTMIYISDVSGGDVILSRVNILTTGFYFFDGSLWQKVNGIGSEYAGSTSIALNGNSFERAALTGDVVANLNSNTTIITDNAVTTTKLADNSVNSEKIINGTIITEDLANNSVNSAKIINGTIIAEDLASNSVINAKIANNAVTINKLPAGATSSTFLRGDGAWATPSLSRSRINANGGLSNININGLAYTTINGTNIKYYCPIRS